MSKEIYLCAINNILSGNCSEDCSFCTQSGYFDVAIQKYRFKPIDQIIQEAKIAKQNWAIGYCLVTAGRGLDDKKTEQVAKIAKALKQEISDINLIGCNGIATKEQLRYLKANGIDSYNHNLESSREYYKQICSTHAWEDRYQTCQNAKEIGLKLCVGGIYGMGESKEDRDELIKSIVSLNPESTPINFFIPNPALPLQRNIEYIEALDIIKKLRDSLPKAMVMVAGGREITFDTIDKEKAMFNAGANAIVIGNYLTTKGRESQSDIQRLESMGLKIAKGCNE